MATSTAVVVAPKPAEPKSDALTATADALARLPQQQLVLGTKKIGDLVPDQAYEGASKLVLTTEEKDILATAKDVPDDDIGIRPDGGFLYANHMFYRDKLTEVFGPGQWALIPVTDVNTFTEPGGRKMLYATYRLVVRGCFVAKATGWAQYHEGSERANMADAFEIIESDVIAKLCAKSSLRIGTNPWNRRFANEWRKTHAKQVWVNTMKGRKAFWRRLDDPPFENEVGDYNATPAPAVPKEPVVPQSPTTPPRRRPEASAAHPGPGNLSDGKVRLFFAVARKCSLIVGDEGRDALAFLCETLGELPQAVEQGKTSMEALHAILRRQTSETFDQKILPALRAREAEQTTKA